MNCQRIYRQEDPLKLKYFACLQINQAFKCLNYFFFTLKETICDSAKYPIAINGRVLPRLNINRV